MKINFEVDLQDVVEEMFSNESCDLSEAVKSEITRSVVRQISDQAKTGVEKLLFERINPQVQMAIDAKVSSVLDTLLAEGDLVIRGEKVKFEDHIRDVFTRNTGWNNPTQQIEKIAKSFGEQMKLQYNNIFAMNIVRNLSEQGLLNDDVAKSLLAPAKN